MTQLRVVGVQAETPESAAPKEVDVVQQRKTNDAQDLFPSLLQQRSPEKRKSAKCTEACEREKDEWDMLQEAAV